MAIIHHAELKPSKLELLAGWLPRQRWFPSSGSVEALERVAAYRFDDPDGEVGIESLIVCAGRALLHVPVTYRGAPLAGGEPHLIGTMQHSVLGRRWVYDGIGDPVYVTELVRVIATGDTEVAQYYDTPTGPELKIDETRVAGSGASGTVVPADVELDLEVVRLLDDSVRADGRFTLTGTWEGRTEPVLLASLAW